MAQGDCPISSHVDVAVTGSTGVIGSAVVSLLTELGLTVVGLSSKDADLRSFDEAQALFSSIQPRAIIHLAGRVRGVMGNSMAQGEMYLDNLRINTNTVEAARLIGVEKIVAMGSVSVYADGLVQPMREDDIWQGAPHHSEAGYAHAKRSMLAQLEAYHDQYGLNYALAVSTNLFGPNDRFDEIGGHVVPSLISKFYRAIKEGTSVTVWGSGTPTRDLLFSRDAAAALVLLLNEGSGVYNVASGSNVSIDQLASLLKEISGYRDEIFWDATKPDGQSARSYNIERLTDLGWRPETHLQDALRLTFDWYSLNEATARRSPEQP